MNWNYIDSLNQVYNEYFFRYDKGPLLIINTNDNDQQAELISKYNKILDEIKTIRNKELE